MNITRKIGVRRIIICSLWMIVVFLVCINKVDAVHTLDDKIHVLVVYSSKSGELDEHQRILDMLIGHFTANITFKNTRELDKEDLKGVTHLFYYGQQKEQFSPSFKSLIQSFKTGTFVALGYNVEQLGERFSFVEHQGEAKFSKISLTGEEDKIIKVFPQTLLSFSTDKSIETLIEVSHGQKSKYSLFVKNESNYYYASPVIDKKLAIFLAETFHTVFKADHENSHPSYIRLEDVHPYMDPDALMAIAQILKEKEIPYMVAVIPVYTNPETNREYYFSDSPKLLKVLKYIQDNGGSIVLHGYTHQFRSDETGEGFEFWDVENNMPIYHDQHVKVVKKTAKDFASLHEYEQYLKEQINFETNYIEKKLQRGVQELTNYGIFPLAFEAPHYTMSQNGYAVTSRYFSTYVGQVQLSDHDWKIMTTSPYITAPKFLQGMQLLPETLGYVQPKNPKSIEMMLENAKNYMIVRDGMIAGFYHPYLGVDKFITLINELEKIPRIEWIDLKEMENIVRVDYVEIKSDNGMIHVDIDRRGLYVSSIDFFAFQFNEFVVKVIWGMVGASFLAIVLFISYIYYHRKRSARFG